MIAAVFFPSFSTALFHLGDALIARLDMAIASFAFSMLGILAGRYYRFDGGGLLGWRISQQSMDVPPIIRAIGIASSHRRFNLGQQGLELPCIVPIGVRHLLLDDILCVRVDPQMELTPGPARRRAVHSPSP